MGFLRFGDQEEGCSGVNWKLHAENALIFISSNTVQGVRTTVAKADDYFKTLVTTPSLNYDSAMATPLLPFLIFISVGQLVFYTVGSKRARYLIGRM